VGRPSEAPCGGNTLRLKKTRIFDQLEVDETKTLWTFQRQKRMLHFGSTDYRCLFLVLHKVTGISEILDAHETLFDAPRTDKPIVDANTSGLVVRPTAPSSAEGLLTHNCTCAFLVVVYIPRRIAEFIGGRKEGRTGGREAVSK
jgi:hypothetical protein